MSGAKKVCAKWVAADESVLFQRPQDGMYERGEKASTCTGAQSALTGACFHET